jgi:hypothetical protein
MKIKVLFLLLFITAFSFAQISSEPQDQFMITPNPGKSTLNIKLSNTVEDSKLEVFDVLGKRVYIGLITKLESSVNVSNWKSGVYLIRVSNNKAIQTKRFIKQ